MGCVLLALPVMLPLAIVIAALVRVTSPGPVFFLQKRIGRQGRVFTIFKFRTLVYASARAHHLITTLDNQAFTSVGPLLRRWKLDELPQLLNVLLGHMSLVGPRPKMPEHTIFDLSCRPGLTGMATVAFAEEEWLLARMPSGQLDAYYYNVVLPAKHHLDSAYAARATLFSDLQLLTKSVFRRWDYAWGNDLIAAAQVEWQHARPSAGAAEPSHAAAQQSTIKAARGWASLVGSPVTASEVDR